MGENMQEFYANNTPFSIRDLSICGFRYLWGRGLGTTSLPCLQLRSNCTGQMEEIRGIKPCPWC
jgi:hypothetical protein